MEFAHQYLTNVENGTKKLVLVLPATPDTSLIRVNVLEILILSFQLLTLFAKHSIAITIVWNALIDHFSMLIEFVLL